MVHSAPSSTTTPDSPHDETLFKDGILYQIYRQPLTLQSIVESQQQAVELLGTRPPVPLIAVLEGQGKIVKLGLSDLGRAVNHEISKHVSVVIIVGAEGVGTKVLQGATQLFFNDRIKYCDTLEEAKLVAQSYLNTENTVLE